MMEDDIKKSNLRILVVDDNPEIHKDFIKILTKYSSDKSDLDDFEKSIFGKSQNEKTLLPQFRIDTVSQGKEGVEFVSKALKEGYPYAVAFVDIRMPPGWDGIETIKHIWKLDSDIQVVICTAYSDYSWEETVTELGQTENLLILKKPFDSVAVRQLACSLTKKWQLIQDSRDYTNKLEEEVKERTASLAKSLSLVKATMESSDDGILVTNNTGNIIDYNKKFVSMWQVPESILVENDQQALLDHMTNQLKKPDIFLGQLNELYSGKDEIGIEEIKLKNGNIFEYYSRPQKVNDTIEGRVFDFRDITKRVKLEKNLEYQATHDALTGLPNRVMLLDRIKQAIKISKKNHSFFVLLFLDLNRFKIINDSLSHAVGDEVLRIVASRLNLGIENEDTLARLGGDEFVIIFPSLKKEEDILGRLRAIQDTFDEPFMIENRNVTVTTSIGISIFPRDGTTADILLRNADAAMYRAKEQRGNSFQFYTEELNAQSLAKLDQEMQLRQALANNEFYLCYQPQVDLKDSKIVAVEALLRWQHPQKGVLLPLDFIQIAEETGLILQIGEWVIRKACQQNKQWQNAGLPPIRVAVNITAQQFMHQNIPNLVSNILKETQLEAKYFELELTENVIVSTPEIINSITELKKMGVMIAIDDFGTGYSSLSYLKKIPMDRLKIDKSFVQHIQSNTDDEVIIRAVISMAKNLNLEVLAEGVENQNQVDFLKKHECGDVQGFYFSKPLLVEQLENFLKNPANIKKVLEENMENA